MMRCFAQVLLILVMLFGVGCGSKSSLSDKAFRKIKSDLAYMHVVVKDFTTAPGVYASDVHMKQCQEGAIAHLRETGLFKSVKGRRETPVGETTLLVRTTVHKMHIVSERSRLQRGILAGESGIELVVKLQDGINRRIINTWHIDSNKHSDISNDSALSTLSRGISDKMMLPNLGYKIGDFVLMNATYRRAEAAESKEREDAAPPKFEE